MKAYCFHVVFKAIYNVHLFRNMLPNIVWVRKHSKELVWKAALGKYHNRRSRVKVDAGNGKTGKGEWWSELEVGATQGGVDSMSLFITMVDEIERDLAAAGVKGVRFITPDERSGERLTKRDGARNMDFADDVVLLIEALQTFWSGRI